MTRDRRPPALEHAPGHLKTAADLAPRDPPAEAGARPPEPIECETEVLFRGRVFAIRPRLRTVAQLDALCDRLDGIGAEPAPRPPEYTADGEPLCQRHRAPMRVREKQGDCWHSHIVIDSQGREHYCKGRPGKDSPGWSVEAAPAPQG